MYINIGEPTDSAEIDHGVESSITKALIVLACFRDGTLQFGVSELARRTGIPKSSVHRLCCELADSGFLVRTPERQYRLGVGVFELGNAEPAFAELRQAMSRFLQQLTVLSGETVHLGVLDGSEVVYLDKIETPQSAGVPSQVGRRNPAHCTGLGKALVAWNSAQHDVLVAQDSLPVFTAHTISTGQALGQELKRVRAERVAYDREERILGIACVATPVMGHNSVVAALSVSGPRSRMTDDRLRELSMPIERVGTAAGNYLRKRFQF